MPLILAKLLTNKEPSPIIVVEDSIKQTSQQLTRKLAASRRSTPSQSHQLVVCCVENPPAVARQLLENSVNASAVFVDVFSSWSYTPSRPDPAVPSATTSTLIEGLERIIPPATDAKTTVLFDSITPFLLHHPIGVFARLLKRLAALGDHVSLILPFHGDVAPSEHTETSVDAILAHVATTYMTVRHGKDFGVMLDGTGDRDVFNAVDANSTVGAVVEFMHKKKSGKIVRELVAYKIPSDDKAPWIVSTLDELRGLDALRVEETKQPDEEPDPAANLSFNLRLTDAQKNARAEVVLPYMHVQTASDTTQQPSTASIYYDDDDYDEEDPDADLDI